MTWVASLTLLACTNTNEVENPSRYFANFTGIVTSYLDYQPRGEISMKQASKMGHYKVDYDEKGLISAISFFKGAHPSDDSYYRTHKVKYEYSKNKLIRTYFNSKGAKSNMWRHYYEGGDIHLEEFEMDNDGVKTKLTFRDSLNQQVSNGVGVSLYIWKKVDDRTVVQQHFKNDGSTAIYRGAMPFPMVKITVDENGYSKWVTNVDKDGNAIFHAEEGFATLEVYFDEYGNEMGWGHLDEKGDLVNLLEKDFGHSLCLFTKEWEDVKLGMVKSYESRYFDKDRNPIADDNDVHETRYTMNKYVRTETVAYYNLSGEKQMNEAAGYHSAQVVFDDFGERDHVIKYDTQGEELKE
jgi:hypothetical protein